MRNNARPHSAAKTMQFLATNDVNVLDWSVNRPNLNPIEQVWYELGHRVRRNHAIHSVNDLAAALEAEWANLPTLFIQHYVNSMCHRITGRIAQNCGHRRYRPISLNLQSLFVS